jgi:hypothetical protein
LAGNDCVLRNDIVSDLKVPTTTRSEVAASDVTQYDQEQVTNQALPQYYSFSMNELHMTVPTSKLHDT